MTFTYWKLLVAATQIIATIAVFLQRKSLIQSGEQIQLAKTLAKIARAADIADEIRHDVLRMTDDEINDILSK